MNQKTYQFVIVGCMLLALCSAGYAQSVVYDNTTNYLGTEHPIFALIGNEITQIVLITIDRTNQLGLLPDQRFVGKDIQACSRHLARAQRHDEGG